MSYHPAPALKVNEVDRAALKAIVRAPTSEQRAVIRARVVLASADGTAISRIAADLGVTTNTVKLWRRRYALWASRVLPTSAVQAVLLPTLEPIAIGPSLSLWNLPQKVLRTGASAVWPSASR